MKFTIKYSFLFLLFLTSLSRSAVAQGYTTGNAHSHNDYLNDIPFLRAFYAGFGSVEADVFPVNGKLLVAHDEDKLSADRSLTTMYLQPAARQLAGNGSRTLSLLIDIKKDYPEAMKLLIKELEPFKAMLTSPSREGKLKIIISGAHPSPAEYSQYPDYVYFDDNLTKPHTPEQWERVGMVSLRFSDYSVWNGLGRLTEADSAKVEQVINRVHDAGKKIRFWDAPDTKTSWIALMKMGVDYIGTDKVEELGTFLKDLPLKYYREPSRHAVYKPTYKNDGKPGKVKNLILLIGDGMGLPHVYASYTVNGGELNIFQVHQVGLSLTYAFDAYGTDSAAGATAMATGVKTDNRAIGVDPQGKPLKSIVSYAAEAGKKTALITAESVTGATPSGFYAHQRERNDAGLIAADLLNAPVDVLIGSGRKYFQDTTGKESLADRLKGKGYNIVTTMDQFVSGGKAPALVLLDDSATRPVLQGRGEMLLKAFNKTSSMLAENKKGFFMMLEGPKIDGGGHSNNLPLLISENQDFDKVVGAALEFADRDGETLVVITADHETGGLTLLDGDFKKGEVYASFSTNDHTGIPVPVYAYGPHSDKFKGIFPNTDIFKRLMEIMRLYK